METYKKQDLVIDECECKVNENLEQNITINSKYDIFNNQHYETTSLSYKKEFFDTLKNLKSDIINVFFDVRKICIYILNI